MQRLSVLTTQLTQSVSRQPQTRMAAVLPTAALKSGFCSSASEEEDSVLFEPKSGRNYLVTLNQPKTLNALNLEMIGKLTEFYRRASSEPCVIVLKGAGQKAFCAGGDVVKLCDLVKAKAAIDEVTQFFASEYVLDHLLATVPPHVHNVCLLNGVTMGGGVGLSVHGRYRVATDKTLFAMPETAIGFYTDVGGAHFLPRLVPKGLGEFLALTGHRLLGADVLHAGVATHFVASERMQALESELLACESPEMAPSILAAFGEHPSNLRPFTLAPHLHSIAKHFQHDTVEQVMASLKADSKVDAEFSAGTVQTLKSVSPTSLKLIHRALKNGERMDLKQVLDMEFAIVRQCMLEHDFCEGVRAQLVDKCRKPKWKPATLEEVTDEQIDKYFP